MSATLGCQTTPPSTPTRVEDAWTPPHAFVPDSPGRSALPTGADPASPAVDGLAIAFVGGVPIPRGDLIDLLIEGHGVGAFEQLLVLHSARRLADERGLTITHADVDAEYDRAIQSLLGETVVGDPAHLRRQAGETLLDDLLASRNLARSEFAVVMQRNAYLRKLVLADLEVTEPQLRDEFARRYGERVEIRHIQLVSRSDVGKVVAQRAAGVDFGELAMRYSANRGTGEKRGLLPPFAADDPDIPKALRDAAFSLPVGRESETIQVADWYHLIRVERRIPARRASFDDVRGDLERSLRPRLTDAHMQTLYAELFGIADIRIVDPKLRELFFQKHADHASAPAQ